MEKVTLKICSEDADYISLEVNINEKLFLERLIQEINSQSYSVSIFMS